MEAGSGVVVSRRDPLPGAIRGSRDSSRLLVRDEGLLLLVCKERLLLWMQRERCQWRTGPARPHLDRPHPGVVDGGPVPPCAGRLLLLLCAG